MFHMFHMFHIFHIFHMLYNLHIILLPGCRCAKVENKYKRERARQRIPLPRHHNRNRIFLATLNLGGSGAGLLETPTDLMNADMSVTKRQQISAQQRMRRLKNKIFLSAYRKGDEMTPEEEERGRRLQLARVKKNEMQRERYRRTAEEERKLKNVIRKRFAEEERKLKNVCVTVTDICRIRQARKR